MKKVFKNILKILIILLIAYIMINNNLKLYSVYYAKNMPNTRKEIEMMVLIDNLDWVKTPELEGYKYYLDGNLTISKRVYYNGRYLNPNFYSTYDEGQIYIYMSVKGIDYWFNNEFKLVECIDENNDYISLNLSKLDEEAIKQEIYDFVKPIIDVQPEPKVNLQWLFNLVYIDKYR